MSELIIILDKRKSVDSLLIIILRSWNYLCSLTIQ